VLLAKDQKRSLEQFEKSHQLERSRAHVTLGGMENKAPNERGPRLRLKYEIKRTR